jgi:alpha-methylacyl-CoA racemase
LAGLRILMLGGIGPSPLCGAVLGGLGAEVIRVDRLAEVDVPPNAEHTVRRSQRSVAIDVKHEHGRDLVRRLAADVEAFVDVFRPGVAERLGIGPDDLLGTNPALVYARMTGWGQDGPYAHWAGHDINYIALTGALHAIGTEREPIAPLNLVGDYGGGAMFLAVGILSGVLQARQSGTGQVIDVAMVDGAALLMLPFFGMLPSGGWQDRRRANPLDGAAHYYGVYETADGRHFAVGAIEPQFYAELCARLEVDIPHDQFDDTNWSVHRAAMASRFREKTAAEWEVVVASAGSCAVPVLSLGEAPGHPHNVARHSFVTVDGVVQPAPAPRFSATPPVLPASPSLPGGDTTAVLGELGLSDTEIDRLLDAGIVRQSAGVT